jgi:hypothetical protein
MILNKFKFVLITWLLNPYLDRIFPSPMELFGLEEVGNENSLHAFEHSHASVWICSKQILELTGDWNLDREAYFAGKQLE